MKKYWLFFIASILMVSGAYSQTAVDALRYSRINIGGTARYMAMGGAFGALGADYTSISTNPGGLGLFTTSEFSITPSIYMGKTESTYNGDFASGMKSNFNLGNLGFVFTSPLSTKAAQSSGWKYIQFATGITRLANFNNHIEINGTNDRNSLLDVYVNRADGIYFKDIENQNGNYAYDLDLAWLTYLINPDNADTTQYSAAVPAGSLYQSKSIDTHGSMNEYDFSLAANYMDRLYIGITIGIPMIRYYEESTYMESNPNAVAVPVRNFKNFIRTESLNTKGNGVNLKFGFIYRLSDWFRFGASVHTPSFFTNMKDNYQASMQSVLENDSTYSYSSPLGKYVYNMNTPLRASGSIAFIIGNIGLVSADYEYVDYTSARFNASDFSFNETNKAIRNSYAPTHNIRIGTEWRYNIFSFRGGFNYATSPYKNNNINDGKRIAISAGVGFRQGPFFMDLAYVYTRMLEDYYLYNYVNEPVKISAVANNTLLSNSILLTLGTRF